MTKDQKRIAGIMRLLDGIGEDDFHEEATKLHEKRCGCFRGPAQIDYYRAIAPIMDRILRPSQEPQDSHHG
jgi:hypothetical protein